MEGSYVVEIFVGLLAIASYLMSRREARQEQQKQRGGYSDGIIPLHYRRED